MELKQIEKIMRAHSQCHSHLSLDMWLSHSTLSRFRDWVPPPQVGETTLLDIGCYQPAIGYYAELGWREIIGVAKEEGECNRSTTYKTASGATALNFILDVEIDTIPVSDGSVDVVLMMEAFEHFAVDPMHAMIEANRVLKPGGLLVFSTPNAAAFTSLARLICGSGPYIGLEFSGFSTNRHNCLYDCNELREVMRASGFMTEVCTSCIYRPRSPGPRRALLEIVLRCSDAWIHWRTGRQIERGDFVFIRARKHGSVVERYPRTLYLDPTAWPDWFKAIREKPAVRTR